MKKETRYLLDPKKEQFKIVKVAGEDTTLIVSKGKRNGFFNITLVNGQNEIIEYRGLMKLLCSKYKKGDSLINVPESVVGIMLSMITNNKATRREDETIKDKFKSFIG